MLKIIKDETLPNSHHLTLREETDLLGGVRYTLQVDKNGKVETTQTLEALDVALALREGLINYYNRQAQEG